ncbi:MAG: flagellar basal body protein [Candidatus Eremiobacteraeota bacterium]|nr:flagellar basal body protein [Candidatus Eremiobacteraeota bacterium]
MADLYQIAASGMAAQRAQMDVIAENLANAGVVRADGSVFRPKTAVVQSSVPFETMLRDAQAPLSSASLLPIDEQAATGDDDSWSSGFSMSAGTDEFAQPAGVTVAQVVEQGAAQYRFDPGNPFAAKHGAHAGYVALPNVDPIQQMIALITSGRAYDADVSMLQAAKQMDIEAADIDRA